MSTTSNPLTHPKPTRPVSNFTQGPWGNQFFHFKPDLKAIEAHQEIAMELKEDVKRELLSIVDMPLIEQLYFIDSIEQLGVAYHFEEEIKDALQHIHEISTDSSSGDLVFTSLCFRLLRQHGFNVSSDVFKEFLGGSNGMLKEELTSDVQGMLSLYEACYVRIHGETILDEALTITKSMLIKFIDKPDQLRNPKLEERISHALKKPLHKRMTSVECVRYMQVYKEDNPSHNKSLLKFAKVDFNLLQESYKQELSEVYSSWWKGIHATSNMPQRDRIVPCFFWATGAYSEPEHSIGRKITIMGGQIITSIDDMYDAYASLEELEIFTEAVQRWDKSCINQIPQDLKWLYQTLILDSHEEMERLLAPKGRSHYVHYAKEEIKALCRHYMVEAIARHKKYIPTLDEYIENYLYRTTGYVGVFVYTLLGLDMATDAEFQWVCALPKCVKASCYILRILNDIGGKKFDRARGLSSLFMDCYMKEYDITTYEEVREKLYEKADELWKDINEGMILPGEVPQPVYKHCVLNMSRMVEVIHDGGEDGFTLINQAMLRNIQTLLIDPIPY